MGSALRSPLGYGAAVLLAAAVMATALPGHAQSASSLPAGGAVTGGASQPSEARLASRTRRTPAIIVPGARRTGAPGAGPTGLDSPSPIVGAPSAPGRLTATNEAWTYLQAVALTGAEYGDAQPLLYRWAASRPPVVWIGGDPLDHDVAVARRTLKRLEALTGLDIRYTDIRSEATFRVHLVESQAGFRELFAGSPVVTEGVVQENWGLFLLQVSADGGATHITSATVAVARATMDGRPLRRQTVDHLIVEEITQAFGPINDSPLYPDSVFQVDPAMQPVVHSPLDEQVVRLMYQLPPGATAAEVRALVDIAG